MSAADPPSFMKKLQNAAELERKSDHTTRSTDHTLIWVGFLFLLCGALQFFHETWWISCTHEPHLLLGYQPLISICGSAVGRNGQTGVTDQVEVELSSN